jgi:hypothetical protein
VPASIEALQAKLGFQHHLAKEHIVGKELDGGSIDNVAVGIVLDVLTLIRRGTGLTEIATTV